jgi:hypothetical protein
MVADHARGQLVFWPANEYQFLAQSGRSLGRERCSLFVGIADKFRHTGTPPAYRNQCYKKCYARELENLEINRFVWTNHANDLSEWKHSCI